MKSRFLRYCVGDNVPKRTEVSLYNNGTWCGKTRAKFYADYAKLELLPVFANLHEAFNSFDEMQAGAERIIKNDFKDYVKEKLYLKDSVGILDKKFDFNQEKLGSFKSAD